MIGDGPSAETESGDEGGAGLEVIFGIGVGAAEGGDGGAAP